MTKQRIVRRDNGFSVIELLITVCVVAVLAFGGWWIWQRGTKDSSQSGSSTGQQQHDQNQTDEYLVITEWGVRFRLPEGLKGDVEYGLVTSTTQTDGTGTAYFEVGKIAELPGSNCTLTDTDYPGNTGKSGGIGVSLFRSPVRLLAEEAALYQSSLELGGYWYYVAPMRDACAGGADDEVQLLVQTADSLADALKRLELAK